MLDLIEVVLKQDGFKVQRIDGSKSLSQRRDALKAFREDSDCLVMLASIDCAGCGCDHSFPLHFML
jgi:SWI/SNF-related matrix-associated actin-dependent regulator of chromatin subfamily A3